jgi:broad specificity phosphatase PhoE
VSLIIKLVRHGESEANLGEVHAHEAGDHAIALSPRGREQAREAGRGLGGAFFDDALVYRSPYRRTRETLEGLAEGAGITLGEGGVRVYEDPRLREVEHGYQPTEPQHELRRTHGWFYYRFHGGESPADCYDRTSAFLESMMRQVLRKKAQRVLVVTHGLTIRCFVMRFLHLTVEQFDDMAHVPNCAVVTLAHLNLIEAPVFTSGRWGVTGISLRPPGT